MRPVIASVSHWLTNLGTWYSMAVLPVTWTMRPRPIDSGAFLAPASEVRKELGDRRVWLEPQELAALKNAYGLSMQAWMHRAKDLGIMSETRYIEMRKYFSKRDWNKTEPGEAYPKEHPQLFDQLVFRALAQDLISESKAAELLSLPLYEFQKKRNMKGARSAAH